MSMLGKVFAILNVLGAAGLLYVAAIDYGKRQVWTYAVNRHDIAIAGLPVSEQETDENGRPLVNRLSGPLLQDVFRDAGQPVETQVAEVQRVKGLLEGQLNQISNRNQQLALYARYLLPFARTNLQREKLLAFQYHLATDATTAELKTQLQNAFNAAKAEAMGGNVRFPEAFTRLVLGLPGEPRLPFAEAMLTLLTTEPNKPFDAAFTESLDAQHGILKGEFDALFQDALQAETALASGQRKQRSLDEHRKVIAHLLFNVVEVLPNPAVPAAPAGQAPAAAAVPVNLLSVEGYRRLFAVVGLRSAVREINFEAQALPPIADELIQSIAAEQRTFALSHDALLSQVRDLALKSAKATADLERVTAQAAKQEALVARRKADVKLVEEDLDAERKVAAARFRELREMSRALYNIRLEVREETVENQNRAQKIAELERTAGR